MARPEPPVIRVQNAQQRTLPAQQRSAGSNLKAWSTDEDAMATCSSMDLGSAIGRPSRSLGRPASVHVLCGPATRASPGPTGVDEGPGRDGLGGREICGKKGAGDVRRRESSHWARGRGIGVRHASGRESR